MNENRRKFARRVNAWIAFQIFVITLALFLSNVFFPTFAEAHNSPLLSLSFIDGDTIVFDRAS